MGLEALRRSIARRRRREPRVPDGRRVYAIGDIHGRADLFAALLGRIRDDDRARGPARTSIVLLGDLIDRGPDSKGVVAQAMALGEQWADVHWLIGNHEAALLEALDGGAVPLRFFVRIGGDATLRSYGIAVDPADGEAMRALAADLRRRLPADHVRFLAKGEDMIRIGDYCFVHAGVAPGVPLDQQSSEHLRWIRDPFLDDRRDHGAVVVHGHTVTEEPVMRPNRIGIDTGAYRSGRLTALGLEGTQQWLLSAAP